MKRKFYLASPFFNEDEIKIYNEVIAILRKNKNIDLFVPREHEFEDGHNMPNNVWGKEVFLVDKNAIDESEVVIVLNFGMYSDSGTAWEAGYAYAKEKVVYQILCGDKNTDYSLMMLNGTTYIMSIDDLRNGIIPNQSEMYKKFVQK